MLTKTSPARIKAVGESGGLEEGQFKALVSVFGNKDSYGDIVQPGAFKNTLAEWEKTGLPIPVYWSHQMADPDMNIGHVVSASETDAGLEVVAQLALDEPKAQQVYRLMKGGRVNQFSFSYDIVQGKWIDQTVNGEYDGYYSLDELKLYEVGPTPIGANQETELLEVKSARLQVQRFVDNLVAGAKAGRVLSAKNETTLREAADALKSAHGSITQVLSALESSDDEKAALTGRSGDETRQGKSPDAYAISPVDESDLLIMEITGSLASDTR